MNFRKLHRGQTVSNPIASTATANDPRMEESNLFPTVMTNNIMPISQLVRNGTTSPQIDLDALDFFAPGRGLSEAGTETVKVAPAIPDGSFGASVLSRSHFQGGSKDGKAETTKLRKPRLLVLRGERIDVQFTIYPGKNYIGRSDDKPVDIDLENQEPADRIWSSRQHAMIHFETGQIAIEDLGSLNGTFVNRARISPNQPKLLQENDVVQIGTVQLKLILA